MPNIIKNVYNFNIQEELVNQYSFIQIILYWAKKEY
jgi:hypothetical protein